MRIKLCGISSMEEANHAVMLGAHALGFVLYGKNAINPEKARDIILNLPPFISAVGILKDQPYYEVEELITFLKLHVLQFDGNEDPDYCQKFNLPVIKKIQADNKKMLGSFEDSSVNAIMLHFDNKKQNLEPEVFLKFSQFKNLILSADFGQAYNSWLMNELKPYALDIPGSLPKSQYWKLAEMLLDPFN